MAHDPFAHFDHLLNSLRPHLGDETVGAFQLFEYVHPRRAIESWWFDVAELRRRAEKLQAVTRVSTAEFAALVASGRYFVDPKYAAGIDPDISPPAVLGTFTDGMGNLCRDMLMDGAHRVTAAGLRGRATFHALRLGPADVMACRVATSIAEHRAFIERKAAELGGVAVPGNAPAADTMSKHAAALAAAVQATNAKANP